MHNSSFYLGIDYGTKRIGIAIGQLLTQTATPLTTLLVHPQMLWKQLGQLIEEWQPRGLVIGVALQEDGSPSSTSQAATQFGRHLAKRFALPIYFAEERLTSVSARNALKTEKKRYDKDSVAAAIILESWFRDETKEILKDVFEQSST
jgi:putative Holliday junction resolvase